LIFCSAILFWPTSTIAHDLMVARDSVYITLPASCGQLGWAERFAARSVDSSGCKSNCSSSRLYWAVIFH
jgi:hypothetical protein